MIFVVCRECFLEHVAHGYFYKCGCECHKKPVMISKYDAYGHIEPDKGAAIQNIGGVS